MPVQVCSVEQMPTGQMDMDSDLALNRASLNGRNLSFASPIAYIL